MLFYQPASYLLVIAPHAVELWGRRRHKGMRLAAFDPANPDFRTTLKSSLVRLRGHPVAIVLNLPDIILQTENLPRVPWLDRRKLLQSRRTFLSYPYDISALFPLSPERALFTAQPQNALLKSILHIVGSIDCPVQSISHMALEAFHLLPKNTQQQSGIAVMRLTDNFLILAHRAGHIITCRTVPLDDRQLPQEVQRTFLYLQRHGWSVSEPITTTTMGVMLPVLPGVPVKTTNVFPDSVPYLEVLAHLVSHTPRFSLVSSYLRKKNRLHQIEAALCNAALLTLAGVVILWGSFFAERQRLDRHIAALQSTMESLPPPLSMTDRAAVVRLDQDHTLSLPLLAALVPINDDIQALQLTLPSTEHQQGELRLATTRMSPEQQNKIHAFLSDLPDWHLQNAPVGRNMSDNYQNAESHVYTLTTKAGTQ